jgi:hypothetical protein
MAKNVLEGHMTKKEQHMVRNLLESTISTWCKLARHNYGSSKSTWPRKPDIAKDA